MLFTSDNGPWLIKGKDGGVAGPLRGGKGSTWEGGMREPTIAWWPGQIAAGSVCDAAVSEIDVLPTLVKLAGGTVPADRKIDGKDIWPLLSGQTQGIAARGPVLFQRQAAGGRALRPVEAGHRARKREIGLRQGQAVPASRFTPRLYNLDTDIGETTDVAAQHPDVVARLQGYIQQMDADLGQTDRGPGVRPPGKVAEPQPLLKRNPIEYD